MKIHESEKVGVDQLSQCELQNLASGAGNEESGASVWLDLCKLTQCMSESSGAHAGPYKVSSDKPLCSSDSRL